MKSGGNVRCKHEISTQAGELLRTEEWQFDLAFCSVLKRSIKTLQYILEELDQLWIPVEKSWRLNERHYGDLQEVSKSETAKKHGEKQLQDWRRGYDSAPARESPQAKFTKQTS